MTASILVAGIGNIFFGDDAFGVEVAQRLARRPLPDGVRVVDFGIRGFDLAYALMGGEDVAILVDALSRGEPPGTLVVLEPDLAQFETPRSPTLLIDTHGLDPVKALHLTYLLGGRPKRVLVVGCEPASLEADENGQLGLSPPVEAAVEAAITLVESLLTRLLDEISPGDPVSHQPNAQSQSGRGEARTERTSPTV